MAKRTHASLPTIFDTKQALEQEDECTYSLCQRNHSLKRARFQNNFILEGGKRRESTNYEARIIQCDL